MNFSICVERPVHVGLGSFNGGDETAIHLCTAMRFAWVSAENHRYAPLRRISCHGRNYLQPYFFKRNQSSDNRSHGFGAKFLLKKLSASDFSYERKSAFRLPCSNFPDCNCGLVLACFSLSFNPGAISLSRVAFHIECEKHAVPSLH